MSLDSHYIVTKQSSFPSPFLIAPLPNAIRRPLQSPLFQALLVAVPSRGKGEGQLHSSSWSVGVVLISWQAGPGCRLHWHLHLSLSSFSDWVSPLFYPSLRPVASARSAGCWWLTPPPTPPSSPSPPPTSSPPSLHALDTSCAASSVRLLLHISSLGLHSISIGKRCCIIQWLLACKGQQVVRQHRLGKAGVILTA